MSMRSNPQTSLCARAALAVPLIIAGGVFIRPAAGQYSPGYGGTYGGYRNYYNFGVGRMIDPGQLRSTGQLAPIGGFQRVTNNPALQSAVSRGAPVPTTPIGMGTMGASSRRNGYWRDYQPTMSNYYGQTSSRSMRRLSSMHTPSILGMRGWGNREIRMMSAEEWNRRGLSMVGQRFLTGDLSFVPQGSLSASLGSRRRQSVSTSDWLGRGRLLSGTRSLRSELGAGAMVDRSAMWREKFQAKNPLAWDRANVAVRARQEPQETHPSRRTSETQPAIPMVSVDQVVAGTLQTQLDYYVKRGWSQFRARRYSDAYNSFALADRIRPSAAEAKKLAQEAQIGLIFSAIATSRYIAAAHAWLNLVNRNSDEDLQGWLVWAKDLASRYGSNSDYTAHYRAFEDYMRLNRTQTAVALNALVLWARGDEANARFTATSVAEGAPANSPYSRLADLMDPNRGRAGATPRG